MSTQLQYGDIVTDREDPEGQAIVVSTPSVTISEWTVMSTGHTVAEDNPTYPPDDPVVIVLWENQINDEFPYYTGVRPLSPSLLSTHHIHHYSFPATRLTKQDEVDTHTVPLNTLRPSPYHSRSFSVTDNQQFLADVRQQGIPGALLVRVLDSNAPTFELLDGHKRAWAGHVVGLEEVPVMALHINEEQGARTWANRHLNDYDAESTAAAAATLHQHFPEVADDILTTT
jgi:ParB family chromosome partitioning protein